jgi:hypothetical protein
MKEGMWDSQWVTLEDISFVSGCHLRKNLWQKSIGQDTVSYMWMTLAPLNGSLVLNCT